NRASLYHMDQVMEEDIPQLARRDIVVTLLPGANYFWDWNNIRRPEDSSKRAWRSRWPPTTIREPHRPAIWRSFCRWPARTWGCRRLRPSPQLLSMARMRFA